MREDEKLLVMRGGNWRTWKHGRFRIDGEKGDRKRGRG